MGPSPAGRTGLAGTHRSPGSVVRTPSATALPTAPVAHRRQRSRVIVLPSPGSPPVAVISPASGPEAAPIALDGSGSTDPDGDTLSYAWDLDADGAFDDASAAITSVTIPVAGSRTVRLQVTDPAGHTALADRTITATNVIPVVSAGADTTTGQERLYSEQGRSWTLGRIPGGRRSTGRGCRPGVAGP